MRPDDGAGPTREKAARLTADVDVATRVRDDCLRGICGSAVRLWTRIRVPTGRTGSITPVTPQPEGPR